jgi:DNA-binding winged helix-turn-helix (wHTH) protein/predicted Zn-dependent protease
MRTHNSLARKPVYEFGEFRLDSEERVLLKDGRPLSIFPKSLDVLIFLLENRGHILGREEIIRQVWPDLFVEGNNLSFNISVLRKALGDSSSSPRYIETISKRGYRFIGSVQEISADVQPPNAAPHPPNPLLAPVIARRSRSWYAVAGAALILTLAGVTTYVLNRSPELTNKDTIVLGDFTNKTGDPVFDGTLNQGLSMALEQSRLVSDGRVRRTLTLMGRPVDSAITPEIAREICVRTGSAAIIEPSITSFGRQYVLGLVARSCNTRNVLYAVQLEAPRKEKVIETLNRLARDFRSHLGESRSLQDHDDALADATTPSLEALKAFSTGWKVLAASGSAAALPLFQRATEIDSNFAMAYAYLGRAYADVGESQLSAENTKKAYGLRNRATTRERFFIDASYHMQVTGNLERAEQICELWAQAYPYELDRDMNPYGFLAGIIDPALAKYENAMRHARKMRDLDPDFAIALNVLAISYQQLNRLGEAEDTLRQASARKLDLPDLWVDRYQIAFLKADESGMEQVVALAQQKPGAEDLILSQEALRLAYHGQRQQAEAKSKLAMEFSRQSGQPERVALFGAAAALREAFFGNSSAAKRNALASLKLSNARDVEYGAAFALALIGNPYDSQTLSHDLERRFPEDTMVRFNYLPGLRALLSMKQGQPTTAIKILEAAGPYELSAPPCSFPGSFGALYPAYVRGQAYLAAHRGPEALKEFQKIIDHRALVVSDPIGALAHWQLGRAFALGGQNEKAKAAYADFLFLWKDADADVSVLKEAKREYARLH